jgi:uncharacterized protein
VSGSEDGCASRQQATTVRSRAGVRVRVRVLAPPLLLSLLVLLPGCGHSPNTTFFVLNAVRPDTPSRSRVVERIQVRAVHIPDELDRSERVSEQSGDRLRINQFQQWGAPLADMIRRVVSEDLAARLPGDTIVPPEAPAPPGTRGLVLDVQEFLPTSSGQVVLQATWTLLAAAAGQPGEAAGSAGSRSRGALHGDGSPGGGSGQSDRTILAAGTQRLELRAGGRADAQVSAMSQLLGRLADAIVVGVSRPPSS